MKKMIKILSVFLATIMFFSVFSAANPVFAVELQKTELSEEAQLQTEDVSGSISDEQAEEDSSTNIEVLDEIIELRDEYTKYFRQSDGSYIAAQYSAPVHYLEGDDWVEYNFELEEKQSEKRLFTSSSVYEPVASDIPVKFPAEFSKDDNNEISINIADTTISFAPKAEQSEIKNTQGKLADEAELVSANVTASAEISTFSQATELENENEKKNNALKVNGQKGAVKYEEVYEDVSLEYELSSNVLKESIVLNEPQNKNAFEFTMNMGSLYPREEADGSIVLYEDVEYTQAKSVIMAPYMLDSAGAYSDAVTMDITPDGENYTLTVTADEDWLNSSERAYPVIIDPTIVLDISRSNTQDCYVDASRAGTPFLYDYYLYAGHSTLGKTRAFIRFNLPALNDKCCVIQNVTLNIYQMSVDAGSDKRYISAHRVTEQWSTAVADAPTWNNQPSYDSVALDYAELTYNVGDFYSFDITEAAKAWFEGGNNYGVMLKGFDESKVGRAQIISSQFNIDEIVYPTVSVTYRNNKGLEGYWSYSSFSQASCGSASVNDYTGNLVYQIPLASTVSEIMPVSLSLVYNTYSSGETYVSGKNGSSKTTPAKGWKFNIQETVLPSSNYGLTGDNAEKYPYVYTDGDGTEHYIQKVTKKDENKKEVVTYEDEDGLGLTVEKIGSEYKITDKMDNVRLFNSQGNLKEIKDANGNSITIKLDDETGKKIEKITDGTGHTLEFGYYENLDYVNTITDNAGRVVNINISNGNLVSVYYYDGTQTHIVYETAGTNLINYVWSSDRVGLNFDYTASSKGYRVRKVTEFGAQKILPNVEGYAKGQVVTFDRTKYNTTVIRSGGIDGITYDTSSADTIAATQSYKNDDIVTTLQFDNFGRTTSQQVSYGNGGEVGAGAYNYTATSNTSDSKNKIADAASLGKNTVNMLTNGNCESLTGWTQNSTSGMDTAHYTSTGTPYVGLYSIAIANANLSTTTGNSNYGQTVADFTVGKSYTFSAFVKTINVAPIGLGGLEGAYLQISATGGSENKTVYSQVLKGSTSTDINNGWRRISVTVEVPAGTTSLKVYMCLRNANGYAYFDSVQLEQGTTPNSVNILQNPSFEAVKTTNAPTYWAMENITNTTNDGSTTTHKDGAKGLKINGEPGKEKTYFQSVEIQGNPNDTYIVSGWAKADAVSSSYHSHYEQNGVEITDKKASEIFGNTDEEDDETVNLVEDSRFEIAVTVWYRDQNNEEKPQDKTPVKFNTNIGDWQYGSTPIVLKYVDDKTTTEDDDKTYTPFKIKLSLTYANQVNSAYFDHIQLIKDVAQSYVYDKDGNLVSVSANAEQKNNMQYDGEDNLTEYKDAGGNTTTFEYQEKTHNLTKVTSPKGVKTEYSYNSKGQNTVTETVNTGGAVKIKTETEYTSNGAYVSKVKDQNGYATTYTYDNATGSLLTTTSPNGLVTENSYIYNYSKLGMVSAQNTNVAYDYINNRLNSICIGYGTYNTYNETYSFTYDNFGNVLETKVGGQPLSTNTYIANNGGLSESVYGNRDGVKYEYNYSGNVSKIYHKDNANVGNADATYGSPVYAWQYSSNGTPRVHRDGINQIKYDYSYDSIGRLIRTDMSNTVTSSYIGSTEYGYNTRGHLTSVSNEIGGRAYNQYYSYSNTGIAGAAENAADGLPTRYTALGYVTDYSYDSLNRLTKRNLDLDNDIESLYFYHSSNRGGSYATSQLSRENLNGTNYSYTYDSMGNITEIKKNGNAYRAYTYDELGQLTIECQYDNKQMILYGYNHLGNIVTKDIFTYSDTALTNETGSKLYEYRYGKDGKDGWNYLLTSYDENNNGNVDDNEKISYDNIGNPLTYRGAQMAWKGRQLTGYAKNGTMSTFSYDADGLRATKTVGGVKTVYQYVGDKLYYEKRGDSQEFYYFYDSYGNLSTIYYGYNNGTTTSRAIYHTLTNAQGDVIAIYNNTGALVATYEYDAWGNVLSVKNASGNPITQQTHIANANPIRYRGYYYDSDLDLYYLQSRYYDSETGRFINADSLLSQDSVLGYNVFAYCTNNPVNMSDPSGHLPKWLSGVLNVISGASQMMVGAALGATVGWTGVGAVAAGFLVLNGGATVIQGAGQIVNDVTNSNVMREDNFIRTGVVSAGRTLAGDTGGNVAGFVYDSAVIVAGVYAGKVQIENCMPKIVNSKLFEINGGYGISLGKTSKVNYGNVNLFYQNPSFIKNYGIRGGTFISILNDAGECLYRIDWDPKDGLHTQGKWCK